VNTIDLATQFKTPDLDKIIKKMGSFIDQYAKNNDPRERFLLLYRTFKNELRMNIQKGRFVDAKWSEAICCRMAETYFEAVDSYHVGGADCPQCWIKSFNLSLDGKPNLLQDALLGMNAHINYDLAIATYDTLQRFDDLAESNLNNGIDLIVNRRLKSRYYDYLMINQIAWESIPQIQDVLAQRFNTMLGILNKASFRVSKYFMEKIIMEYRDRSWGNVLLMATISDSENMKRLKLFMDMQAKRNIPRIMSGLSKNPVTLLDGAIHGFPKGDGNLLVSDNASIGELLISKLHNPSIASYASRAIIEYGEEAQPFLISNLKKVGLESTVGRHIIRILGEIQSESAKLTLIDLLNVSDTRTRDLIYSELNRIAAKNEFSKMAIEKLTIQINREAQECFEIKQQQLDLQQIKGTDLLIQSLNFRLARGLLRLKTLLVITNSNYNDLPDREKYLSDISPQKIKHKGLRVNHLPANIQNSFEAIRQLFQNNESILPNRSVQEYDIYSGNGQKWIYHFLDSEDIWLQLCCLHNIFANGWKQFIPEVKNSLRKYPELKKDFENFSGKDAEDFIQQSSEGTKQMLSTIEKVLYLKNIELFNEIPAEDLTQVARLTREVKISSGNYLIQEKKSGNKLFIILDGIVEILKGGIKITELEMGSVVGEMSLLSNMQTTADCRASSEVNALTINREDFRNLLYGEHPEIAIGLLKVLTERLEQTTRELQQIRDNHN